MTRLVKKHPDMEFDRFSQPEFAEHWEAIDASQLLESREEVSLQVLRPVGQCPSCGSCRVRGRILDVPILDGSIRLQHLKVLYCPECKEAKIEAESIERFRALLERLYGEIQAGKLDKMLQRELVKAERRLAKWEQARKVISVYFPAKDKIHGYKKAQISLSIRDPLYRAIRFLRSEEIRDILGLTSYEDLVRKAATQQRPISQYIKRSLARKLLNQKEKAKSRHP